MGMEAKGLLIKITENFADPHNSMASNSLLTSSKAITAHGYHLVFKFINGSCTV